MTIVPMYAALLALLFLLLSKRVINTRRKVRVAVGDGGNAELTRAIAVHNNFAQYVPLALLLLAFMELQRAQPMLLHVLGIILLLARVIHAYGVSQMQEPFRLRTVAVGMTFGVIATASAYLLLGAMLRSYYS
ncbi:MAG TPA: MAPEG family protein [Methylophilaceae bacterium]|nr:MAPEG family protein [Methylophilaceae bacterium]